MKTLKLRRCRTCTVTYRIEEKEGRSPYYTCAECGLGFRNGWNPLGPIKLYTTEERADQFGLEPPDFDVAKRIERNGV